MLKLILVFTSFFYTRSDIILGGHEDLHFNIAKSISNNILNEMKKNCSTNNDIICGVDLIKIEKATTQTVHGYIYDINALTTKGMLDIQLWYQTAPQIVSMHKFILNDIDLLKNIKYFKPNDIIP